MMAEMTKTDVNTGTTDLIPRRVVRALDEVRDARQAHDQTGQRLFGSVVRLYVACREENLRLTGVSIEERTGASQGYISQIWNACELAVGKKRKVDLEAEAQKLGFRQFKERYLPAPRKKEPGTLPRVRTESKSQSQIYDGMQILRQGMESELPLMTPEQRQQVLLDLLALVGRAQQMLH
jgi:hypothetical protein